MSPYFKSINLLLPLSSSSVINIIDGKVSNLKKDYLDMDARVELFKYFLLLSDIKRRGNEEIIENVKEVLLHIIYNEDSKLFIFRVGDLSDKYVNILIKFLSMIEPVDLVKRNLFDFSVFNDFKDKMIVISNKDICSSFISKRSTDFN